MNRGTGESANRGGVGSSMAHNGKGQHQPTPAPAGLDDLDVPTNETDVPPTYFAGLARLNVSWICPPVITLILPSPTQGGGK